MKKTLSILIIVLALGCVGIEYVAEKTVATTNELIEDAKHTDWVKCAKEAKECEVADTIAIADTTNTVGDGIR